MWPVRFTDVIFASIILIVCAHGRGEGLIILSRNYFFEVVSLCCLIIFANNYLQKIREKLHETDALIYGFFYQKVLQN